MLFDEIVALVERKLSKSRGDCWTMVARARLFSFEQPLHVLIQTLNANPEVRLDPFKFFLPFPTVAIDAGPISAIFSDPDSEARSSMFRRRFLLAIRTGDWEEELARLHPANATAFAMNSDFAQATREMRLFFTGWFQLSDVNPLDEHSVKFEFDVETLHMGEERKDYSLELEGKLARQMAPLSTVRLALNYLLSGVAFCNLRTHFIVERTPKHIIERPNRGHAPRLARSVDRSTYAVLTPGEIRRRYDIFDAELEENAVGVGGRKRSVGAHPRRAHDRILTAERFLAEGETSRLIRVRSTWVGPDTFDRGRAVIKVMLDV